MGQPRSYRVQTFLSGPCCRLGLPDLFLEVVGRHFLPGSNIGPMIVAVLADVESALAETLFAIDSRRLIESSI